MGDYRLHPGIAIEPMGGRRSRAAGRTAAVAAGETIVEDFARWRKWAAISGVTGLVLAAVGFFVSRAQFFESYLWAFLFWFSIALGCLPLLMIYHLVGGSWGFTIRRIMESGIRTLPLMAVLFIPIVFGIHDLYEW